MDTAAAGSIPTFIVERDEVRLPADCIFGDACFAEARLVSESGNWRPVVSVLTFTRDWGLVWRADFIAPSGPRTRVVCWQPADRGIQIAFAVVTDLPALSGTD